MSNSHKPGLRRVPSDDCVVTVGDTLYTPHAGEYVDVIPGFKVADFKVVQALADLKTQLDALDGEPDAQLRSIIATSDAYALTLDQLRKRVVRWTWTDERGEPYPQPCDDPDVFDQLGIEETNYLGQVIRGLNPGLEKKDSKPSATTSSATPSPETTAPATDRSPSPDSLPRSARRSVARRLSHESRT